MRNLTRALLLVAALGSTAMAGCAATDSEEASEKSTAASAPANQPTAGEAVDDGVVTAKVKARLVDDPVTKAYQINVETFKGIVQLSGLVDSAEARSRATQLARETGGVKDVKNSLEVRKSEAD